MSESTQSPQSSVISVGGAQPRSLPDLRRLALRTSVHGAIAGSALLLWACHRLIDHVFDVWVAAALAIGVGAWLLTGNLPVRLTVASSLPKLESRRAVRLPALVLAVALVPVAFLQAGDNQFRLWGVVAWVGAVAAWLIAWWPSRSVPRASWLRVDRASLLVGLVLVAIVGLGAYARFSQISEIPAEPTSDHAEKLLDVTDLLNGERPVFFERNTGREPIQFYFTAFALIRGLDMPVKYETLKVGMAIADTLAIVAVFLLAAELAGREVGLLAALLHATAAWSTITGTFGLRPSLGPLTAGLALWAFLRYLRTGDRRTALLTGFLLGAGLFGYTAFRTVPLAVGLALVVMVLLDPRRRGLRRRALADAGLMIATAAIVFIPLLRYITQYWDRFWYRTATRAGSAELELPGSGLGAVTERIRLLAENNWHAAQMFHWRGDVAWVNFAPSRPALDFVSGAGMLIGCAVILRHLILTRDLRFATVLVAIPILLLSSTLALAFPHEVPSISRSFLVAPLIFTIAAIGLVALRRVIAGALGSPVSIVVATVLLVLVVNENEALVREYDVNYRATVVNSVEIAQTVIAAEQELGIAQDRVFLLGAPHWLDHRNVAFELGDIGWGDTNHIIGGAPIPLVTGGEPALFIVHSADQERLAQLWQRWPDGTAVIVQSERPGKQFGLFFVNVDLGARAELNGIPLLVLSTP